MSTANTVFTNPSQPVENFGSDNVNYDLIVSLNDIIDAPNGQRYQVAGLLGQGQFGQVFQVIELGDTNTPYAMKIAKSLRRYHQQAEHEVNVHKLLLSQANEQELATIPYLVNSFVFKNHLCVVMELLSLDLYNVLKRREFMGLPLKLIQSVAREMLTSLVLLKRCHVVHGDIKPENIVLADGFSTQVKMIDFGSARLLGEMCSFYVQSRYYRAPEVVLRIPHGCAIDMWSLGCVLVELFLGVPLFAGQSEVQLLDIIVGLMGQFPESVVRQSPRQEFFFPDGRLKSEEQICREAGVAPARRYNYLTHDNVPDLIMSFRGGLGKTPEEREVQIARRRMFTDFIMRTLALAQEDRIKPEDALQHEFITEDFS